MSKDVFDNSVGRFCNILKQHWSGSFGILVSQNERSHIWEYIGLFMRYIGIWCHVIKTIELQLTDLILRKYFRPYCSEFIKWNILLQVSCFILQIFSRHLMHLDLWNWRTIVRFTGEPGRYRFLTIHCWLLFQKARLLGLHGEHVHSCHHGDSHWTQKGTTVNQKCWTPSAKCRVSSTNWWTNYKHLRIRWWKSEHEKVGIQCPSSKQSPTNAFLLHWAPWTVLHVVCSIFHPRLLQTC